MDIYTPNLIPKMTGYTTNGVTISASSEWNANFRAWMAFDRISDSSGGSNSWASLTTTGWIKVDFGVTKVITKYTIQARGYSDATTSSPKTWTFEGSVDDINWIVLDNKTNENSWTVGSKKEYSINNINSYRYYRINITENNGNAQYTDIDELEMMGYSNKYLIKKDSNYYSIKAESYDPTTTHNFTALSLAGGSIPSKSDIETFGFTDLNILTNSITIGSDTFIPLNKLGNNFDIKLYKPN